MISTNIRFDNPSDGENQWGKRKSFLANSLLEFDPQLIASQEGRRPQILEFESLLEDFQLIAAHRPWIEERMYPCLFIKKSWGNVMESGDLWLSETPNMPGSYSFNSAFPRLATWALVKPHHSEQSFFVINTHLDHVHSETRQKQIAVLLNEMRDYFNAYPSILSGDFNESPCGETRLIINNSNISLKDPWYSLNLLECGSYHSFNGEKEEGTERIDWILHSKQFEAVSMELDKRHHGTMFLSDHYPVKLVLKMNFT